MSRAVIEDDHRVSLAVSTVDGNFEAILVCSECEKILMVAPDGQRVARLSELECDHENTESFWEQMGMPL